MPHNFHAHIPYFLKKEITELYITNALRQLANAMVSIFIPIFLYKEGFSIFWICFYFLVKALLGMPFMYFALKYAARWGIKHAIGLSTPFMILYFLGLYNFSTLLTSINPILLLIVVSLIDTVRMTLYWAGFHIDFSKNITKTAKQLSIVSALTIIVTTIGPFLGAIIITAFSFQILFAITITILLLSIIPLMFSGEVHEQFEIKVKNITSIKKGIPYIAEGFRWQAAAIYWPMLLYLLAIELTSIGGVYTVANAFMAIFTLYVGKKITDKNRFHIIHVGTFLHSFSLVVRAFLKTVVIIAFVQTYAALTWVLVELPFQSIFYENTKKHNIVQTVLGREQSLNVGKALASVLAMILVFFVPEYYVLTVPIVIAALATFAMRKIKVEN